MTTLTPQDFADMMRTLQNNFQTMQLAIGQLSQQAPQQGQALSVNPRPKSAFELMSKKIDTFNGENFSDWKFKLRTTSMATLDARYVDVLDAAAMETKEIKLEDFEPTAGSAEGLEASKQLYYLLSDKFTKEPFDLIKNVYDLNGFEAWRRLNLRYDSKTVGKRVALIRKVINPTKVNNIKRGFTSDREMGRGSQEIGVRVPGATFGRAENGNHPGNDATSNYRRTHDPPSRPQKYRECLQGDQQVDHPASRAQGGLWWDSFNGLFSFE